MQLESMELFALLGAPARMFGRLLLVSRYLWGGASYLGGSEAYSEGRYGRSWRWRIWLRYDLQELEVMEELINRGTDRKVLAFRKNQLDAFQMVSIVGALVAGAALSTQQLPGISEVSYVARGLFFVSLLMSLLATFFTCVQQRTYGFLDDPSAIRAWLTNGVRYTNYNGREVFQSSIVSHQILQAPFELLCISITSFIGGIGVYLGSCVTQEIKLGIEEKIGNRGVLIVFGISTFFALSLLGQLVGGHDREEKRCRAMTRDFNVGGARLALDEEGRKSRERATPSPTMDPAPLQFPNTYSTNPGLTPKSAASLHAHSRSGWLGNDDEKPRGLMRALEQAAAAHRACAAADLEVAQWYESLR